MKSFRQELQSALDERKRSALFRQRRTLFSPQGTEVILDGEHVTSFCSNDYLGLADHPDVVTAFHEGLDKFGAGSGASHLVSGHLAPHEALEQELAEFTWPQQSTGFFQWLHGQCGRADDAAEQ